MIKRRNKNRKIIYVLEGTIQSLMQATGTISYEPTQFEHVEATVRFTIDKVATYERAWEFWKSIQPDSTLYVELPETVDWSRIEEGELYPRGVPLGKPACLEKFQTLKSNLKPEWISNLQFFPEQQKALIDLLRIGKNAFPGLIQKDAEINVFMKNALQSALLESIICFVKGKGKISALDDLYREIGQFPSISVVMINIYKKMYDDKSKIQNFARELKILANIITNESCSLDTTIPAVPLTGTITSISNKKPVRMMMTKNLDDTGQDNYTVENAVMRINIQTRTIVSTEAHFWLRSYYNRIYNLICSYIIYKFIIYKV